ncbi:glycine betaine ABC transporter substrate-binding protein [Auritidibacter ignavus]|uniref:glycine betaine ABC transporter substrate-binding protein n=1 Tax=Auritidibacter ignavus TaxID=678932 RepID=UPI00109C5091|nr:glycine betaine ABC transporter substrate-binding protein [Auritidibacter ignavus]
MKRSLTWLSSLGLIGSLVLSGCGLGTAGGYTPSGTLTGEVADIQLDGASISVGSKNFTEQILLGKMAVVLLQSAGAEVQDLTSIPGSTSVRQAQLTGDVDLTMEYTGTAWITYMGHTDPIPDAQQQYEAVRDADRANGLTWYEPAEMNNTYTMAVRREVSQNYGITTLDDMTKVPEAEQTFCIDAEFQARNDGFIPMLEAYGMSEPPSQRVSIMDSGAIYAAIANETCPFGEVFFTDGRIKALDLVALEDPRGFFPKYNMAPVVDSELAEQYPQLEDLFAPVIADLDNDRMQELNARVDVDGEDYGDVAYEYLKDLGVVTDS